MKLYYKKKILLLVINITISLSSFAQINEIEKATIINHKLFVPVIVSPGEFMEINFRKASAFLRTFNLDKVNKPTFTSLRTKASSPKFKFPITYNIQDTLVFPIAFSEGNNRISPSFSFFRTQLVLEDTNVVVLKNLNKRKQLEERFPNKNERRSFLIKELEIEAEFNNSRYISPLMCLIYSYGMHYLYLKPYEISYDFVILEDSKFFFIMRDKHLVSTWTYNYPENNTIKNEDSDWMNINNYLFDTIINTHVDSRCENFEFNSNSMVHDGIKDSLFFEGHFKAIRQGDNTFLINQYHGAIYWIGEEAIIKVGQINLQNYTREILGQKLFIEDRDNNQIIFFSEVERLNKEYPFPNIKVILSDKEFNEKFQYVLKSINYINKQNKL